ncbi:MAG: hypothetical protein L0323_21160 [Planctomycetes bacterium]|nr:hypothetical protein [Planctomycetota bacterium]
MKQFLIAGLLSVAAAGFGLAATGGDHGTKAEGGDCPAAALIAKWEKAAAQIAAMPAEKQEAVARAHATLSASCPVCKEAPATFAFLGKFLGSTVALDGLALAAHEPGSKSQAPVEIPQEIASAFEQRVAIGARGNELFAAFARAAAPAGKAECGSAEGHGASTSEAAPAKLTVAGAGKSFEAIAEEASRLTANWRGIPARAAALPAATRSELFAAMEVVKREVPTCDLAKETLTVLAGGLDRVLALDKTLAQHCEESSKAHAGELPVEHAQMKRAFQARTRATAKVAELLRVMEQTMTPEIFQGSSPKQTTARTY